MIEHLVSPEAMVDSCLRLITALASENDVAARFREAFKHHERRPCAENRRRRVRDLPGQRDACMRDGTSPRPAEGGLVTLHAGEVLQDGTDITRLLDELRPGSTVCIVRGDRRRATASCGGSWSWGSCPARAIEFVRVGTARMPVRASCARNPPLDPSLRGQITSMSTRSERAAPTSVPWTRLGPPNPSRTAPARGHPRESERRQVHAVQPADRVCARRSATTRASPWRRRSGDVSPAVRADRGPAGSPRKLQPPAGIAGRDDRPRRAVRAERRTRRPPTWWSSSWIPRQLDRHLYLALQLIELGRPVVRGAEHDGRGRSRGRRRSTRRSLQRAARRAGGVAISRLEGNGIGNLRRLMDRDVEPSRARVQPPPAAGASAAALESLSARLPAARTLLSDAGPLADLVMALLLDDGEDDAIATLRAAGRPGRSADRAPRLTRPTRLAHRRHRRHLRDDRGHHGARGAAPGRDVRDLTRDRIDRVLTHKIFGPGLVSCS